MFFLDGWAKNENSDQFEQKLKNINAKKDHSANVQKRVNYSGDTWLVRQKMKWQRAQFDWKFKIYMVINT